MATGNRSSASGRLRVKLECTLLWWDRSLGSSCNAELFLDRNTGPEDSDRTRIGPEVIVFPSVIQWLAVDIPDACGSHENDTPDAVSRTTRRGEGKYWTVQERMC